MQSTGGNHSHRTPHRSTPILLQLLSSSWTRLSTLMVDTHQMVGNNYNYMQLIISKHKTESIIYVIFIHTLTTYLLCEVETTIPY
jgi:hypothetical protein